MVIIEKEDYKVPVFSWCPEIEEEAQKQIDNVARLPFTKHYISIMSDAHTGFGVPIGTVMACKGAVVVSAVGVDIGCGVLAVKTNITHIDVWQVKRIMGIIRAEIPVGRDWHKRPIAEIIEPHEDDYPVIKSEFAKAKLQLGTLGGGNHFIELQKDTDGFLWFMLHSGSRNIGKKIADYYNKIAKEMNERWFSQVPREWDLAFLPCNDKHFGLYMDEMAYAMQFAQQNRYVMADKIRAAIINVMPDDVKFAEPINIAHNYANWENINGENLIVHRKGATSARQGQLGIVPGSQGTPSYIVEGLGCRESFYSCSHGAGRKMSRTRAQEDLNLEEEIKRLDDQGIVHGIRTKEDLEEAAGAYKSIEEVMENQRDLVKIITKLVPIGVVKEQGSKPRRKKKE